jgi:antitoxin component HigA of HigAB toxin-antitoxin module
VALKIVGSNPIVHPKQTEQRRFPAPLLFPPAIPDRSSLKLGNEQCASPQEHEETGHVSECRQPDGRGQRRIDLDRAKLEARGWTQGDLAAILGRPIRLVNEIIMGKRGITLEAATGLVNALGTSAEVLAEIRRCTTVSGSRRGTVDHPQADSHLND